VKANLMLALGVDVSVSRRLDCVLLDGHRRLVGLPLRAQTPNDLARILATQKPDIVAIDSPPKPGTSGASRLAERELLRLGLPSYFTPSDPEKAEQVLRLDARRVLRLRRGETRRLHSLRAEARVRDRVFPHGSGCAEGQLPPAVLRAAAGNGAGARRCSKAGVRKRTPLDGRGRCRAGSAVKQGVVFRRRILGLRRRPLPAFLLPGYRP
jgi:hypothetical protein